MYFFIFSWCLNTRTSMIKTNVFFSILLVFSFGGSVGSIGEQPVLGRQYVWCMLVVLLVHLPVPTTNRRARVTLGVACIRARLIFLRCLQTRTSRIKTNAIFFRCDCSGTRLVVTLINAYNPHLQLFTTVLLRSEFLTTGAVEVSVREICLYYTCWWYSLCNFPYRQQNENTCSYHFDCWIYTNMYFFIFIVCLNTITSMINTNVFSILLMFRWNTGIRSRARCFTSTRKEGTGVSVPRVCRECVTSDSWVCHECVMSGLFLF